MKLVKSQSGNPASNLFNSAGSQSNLCPMKEVKPFPVTQAAKGCCGLLSFPLFFANSHQKNKPTPVNSKKEKMLRAPVKPERV